MQPCNRNTDEPKLMHRALRADKVVLAAKRDDVAPGAVDTQPPAHADIERVAVSPGGARVVAPIGRNGVEQLLLVINDENDTKVPSTHGCACERM
jgi:hypothetical protein